MMQAENIIRQLNDLLHGPVWIDETFDKKFGQLRHDEEAFVQPLLKLHSVAALTAHLTVWIDACLDRMNGIENNIKDNDENDWQNEDKLLATGWAGIKAAFYKAHQRLILFLEEADDKLMEKQYLNSTYCHRDIFNGFVQHNAYHLGQIGITIKMIRSL